MREHREEVHSRPFDLARHVDFPGQRRKHAPMSYLPAGGGRRARFYCLLRQCQGLVFPIGDPFDFSDLEAQERWLRRHPEQEAAIRQLPPELRGQAIAAHVSGDVGVYAYEQLLAKGLQRTVPKGRRPEDDGRIAACQKHMIAERLKGKKVAEIIKGLEDMQKDERERWEELTGGTETVKEGALRRYWRLIPPPVRDAAAAEAKRRAETGERSALEERLLAALSPSGDLPAAASSPDPGGHEKRTPLPLPGALKERGGPRARRER
jgi:hypothetical protein